MTRPSWLESPDRWWDADMRYRAERRQAEAFLFGVITLAVLGVLALVVVLAVGL